MGALGPHVYLRGQATARPRVSGRCRAIAVSNDGQRIYAGTAQGGTWFSADGGEHWLPLDFYATTKTTTGIVGEANALAVGAVAVRFGSAADGSQDEVFVGTGEQKFAHYSAFPNTMQGVGVRHATGPADRVRRDGVTADPWTLEATNIAGAAVLRLLVDDVTGDVYAATSRGLFRRPTSGAATEWEEIDTDLVAEDITDVAIGTGETGQPRRLWVSSSTPALAFCPIIGPGSVSDDFTAVPLPRIVPPDPTAQKITMVALAPGNTPNVAVVYVLADGPRLWRIRDTAAVEVRDLPRDLFSDQAGYDMAIAVHPTTEDLVVLGGCGISVPESYDAALFVGRVLGSAAGGFSFNGVNAPLHTPQGFVGLGVHADVHDLSWVPGAAGPQLFVACDGGVFRSAPTTTSGPVVGVFDSRNSGIGSIEAQYIAQHPTSDAVLLVGTQDTGGIRPVSPEAWTLATFGDAGGVAFDPLNPRRQIAQYLQNRWLTSTDGGVTFNEIRLHSPPPAGASPDLLDKFEKAYENEKQKGSTPYCTAAVTFKDTVTQLAVATDRVWYSEDWGASWVTLPSGKNPYDPASVPTAPDRTHDAMQDRPIGYVLKWATPNALLVAHQDGIYLFSRASAPGSPWTRTRRYNRPQVKRDSNKKGKPPDGQIRADMPLTDLASHDPNRAGLGSFYVSTSGQKDDHVWWFDGQGHFLRTKLPVDVPVHALAVDPAHPDIVYAGTDIGVWKGVGTIPAPGAGDPHWDWTNYSNGLPEAACIDLVIHPSARLLRAALRGRGVWEVALDGVKQRPIAYLRAHAFDTRRVLPIPAGGPLDPLPADPAHPAVLRLDASPDLKVYRGVGTAPPPFPTKNYDEFDVWVLQSSLRAMGKRIDPNGLFDTLTRSANAEVAPPPGTDTEWKARFGGPNSNKPAFDHDPPDATDITVNLRAEPDRRTPPKTSCATGASTARVFVVVHGRDFRPLPANHVAVFVLRTPFLGKTDLTGHPPLPPGWAVSLRGDLTAPKPGTWLACSKWAYLDPATPFRRPARAVDQREAQIVEFVVPASTWPVGDRLLLAIVHADLDELTATELDLADLVRSRRHAAARSVRRFAP